MDPQELEQLIKTAMQGQTAAGGAAQQTAQALAALTRSTVNQTNASTLAQQASNNLADSQAKARQASGRFGDTVQDAGNRMMGLMQSMYGAEKAFTGFTPVIDTYSHILQSTVKLLGESTQNVGMQIGTFGINIGKLSTLIAGTTLRTLDLLTSGFKIALDSSQKVADSFVTVAKYGATFGTSISQFADTAAKLGIPLQQFAKMVQTNIENISKLGLGVQNGAVRLGEFTSALFDSDAALRAQYGSMEAIAQATSDYMALQSQLGVISQKNSKEQIEGAREYLLRQKELANLTGKTAERLKQEEEARRMELAYASKLSRLGEDAKNNVMEGMAVAGKMFGDRGAKYAQEFFATGGKVISKESLEFAAMMPDAADTIAQFMATVNKGRADYQKGNSAYLEANAGVLEAQARSMEDFAELTYATTNPQLKMMSEVGSAIVNNLSLIKNYSAVALEIEENRKRLGTLRAPTEGEMPGVMRREMPMDQATDAFVSAAVTLRDTQLALDDFVVKQMMPRMGELTGALGELAVKQIQAIDSSIEALKSMTDIAKTAEEKLDVFIETLTDKLKSAGLTLVNPREAVQNLPRQAEGGITSGTTIVGENGPEAVIPLKSGGVPMNIDWTPLVSILRENTDLNREMLDALENSVDVQQRILQASY